MSKLMYSVHSNRQRLDGGAMFGNAPKALWERWIPADSLNRIELACRCLLVRDGDQLILFETGVGAFFAPKFRERYGILEPDHKLIENLSRINIRPVDIDIIVLSHLHFDHAGGLLSVYQPGKKLKLAFPRAEFLVSKKHWARACAPHPRDRASFIPELISLLQNSGRLNLIEERQSDLLGPDYQFYFSDGHTPGMMVTEIMSASGSVVFASDLIPGRAWVHRSITMGYDRFPEKLIEEKVTLLSHCCSLTVMVFPLMFLRFLKYSLLIVI